jgi:hypothetical protein
MDESDSQFEKHSEQRISTLDGIIIDRVMKMKMQMIQFVSIVNLIQMKLRKVIHNMKNSMNKEFQHWMESKLIEVMKMDIEMTQFVSIVNLIQMKLMKMIDMMKNMMNKEFQHWMES